MDQIPSWTANRSSASQKFPAFCRPEASLQHSRDCHLSVFWARTIYSMPPHPTASRSTHLPIQWVPGLSRGQRGCPI